MIDEGTGVYLAPLAPFAGNPSEWALWLAQGIGWFFLAAAALLFGLLIFKVSDGRSTGLRRVQRKEGVR